jgi:dienelactone hydrolase
MNWSQSWTLTFIIMNIVFSSESFAQYQPLADSQLTRDGGNGLHFFYRSKTSVPRGTSILLHGCDGVTPSVHALAKRLADRGIASLIPDSLGIRGKKPDCNEPWQIAPRQQLLDLAAAIETLFVLQEVSHLPFVVIGSGQGGTIAMQSSSRQILARYVSRAPVGVVAFNPLCAYRVRQGPILPIMILIEQGNSSSSASECYELAASSDDTRKYIDVKTYPNSPRRSDIPGRQRFMAEHSSEFLSDFNGDWLDMLDSFLDKHFNQEWP